MIAPTLFSKINLIIIVFLECISLSEPSFYANAGRARIIGGEETNIKFFPYQVSLQTSNEKFFCGGSVIGDKHILTAAHCFDTVGEYLVRVGSTKHAEGGYLFNVTKVITHPDYNGDTLDSDIALLELDKMITLNTRAKLIDLPESNFEIDSGSEVTISGWGRINNSSGEHSDNLRHTIVIVQDFDKCFRIFNKDEYAFNKNNFCASVPGGGKDACHGDSGGPVVIDGKVVGIISWGIGCGDENYPGVYTKVSEFRDWIKEISAI